MAPLPSSFSMANGPRCWPISMIQPVSAGPPTGGHDKPHGSTSRRLAGNCTIVGPAERSWQADSSGQGPTDEFDLHAPPWRPGADPCTGHESHNRAAAPSAIRRRFVADHDKPAKKRSGNCKAWEKPP